MLGYGGFTVINEEYPSVRVHTLLPTLGKWSKIIVRFTISHGDCGLIRHGTSTSRTWIHPGCSTVVVVYKEETAIRCHLDGPAGRQALAERLQIDAGGAAARSAYVATR